MFWLELVYLNFIFWFGECDVFVAGFDEFVRFGSAHTTPFDVEVSVFHEHLKCFVDAGGE